MKIEKRLQRKSESESREGFGPEMGEPELIEAVEPIAQNESSPS